MDAIQKTENVLYCLDKICPWISPFISTRITSPDTCHFQKQVRTIYLRQLRINNLNFASDLLGAPGPRLLLQELYLHQTQRLQTRETHLSSRDIQQGGKYSQGTNSKQKEIQ